MSKNRITLFEMAIAANKCLANELVCKCEIYNLFVIRKMIKRFLNKGVVNEKLLINNIIVAINVFDKEILINMFKLILSFEEMKVLNSIMYFLGLIIIEEGCVFSDNMNSILGETIEKYVLVSPIEYE